MTAKEIIIRLIDTKSITGEEAVILLEALCTPKEIEKIIERTPYWWYINTPPTSIPTTWKENDYTITCNGNINSASSLSNTR